MTSKTDHLLILTQLIVAAAMMGIIWLVQIVTYPQFLEVRVENFEAFHARYTVGITFVVAPLMILELGLALVSAWHFRGSSLRRPLFIGAVLVVALWLTTFLIQVPLHETLSSGWSEVTIRELVATNWIRTVLWTLRLGWLFVIVVRIRMP